MSKQADFQDNHPLRSFLPELSAHRLYRMTLRPIVQWRRRRAAISELSSLSDATLADIGVARGEIERVVDGGFPAAAASPWSTARPAAPGRRA